MNLITCIMTHSYNYKNAGVSEKTGIVVHSTGCNNTTVKRYVQPFETDADYEKIIAQIGKNKNKNDWNHKTRKGGVHAFVGKDANGKLCTVQCLPWDKDAYGVGRGTWIYANAPYYSDKKCSKKVGTIKTAFKGDKLLKSYSCTQFTKDKKTYYVPFKHCGSYNYAPNSRIQFEICEDDLTNKDYFNAAMKEAQEFCAYLCVKFGWGVDKISSHGESIKEGFGMDHEDPIPWLKKFGKNMDWFRAEVQKILDKDKPVEPEKPSEYVPTVKEWQTAASKDGFSFPKAGLDGKWGSECEGVAKKAVCKRRLVHKYPNLTKIVQKVVGTTQDGKFGGGTEKAVKAWQKANKLTVDGHVGPASWKKMLKIK